MSKMTPQQNKFSNEKQCNTPFKYYSIVIHNLKIVSSNLTHWKSFTEGKKQSATQSIYAMWDTD